MTFFIGLNAETETFDILWKLIEGAFASFILKILRNIMGENSHCTRNYQEYQNRLVSAVDKIRYISVHTRHSQVI